MTAILRPPPSLLLPRPPRRCVFRARSRAAGCRPAAAGPPAGAAAAGDAPARQPAAAELQTVRVLAVSDVHADYEANMEWCRSLGRRAQEHRCAAVFVACC